MELNEALKETGVAEGFCQATGERFRAVRYDVLRGRRSRAARKSGWRITGWLEDRIWEQYIEPSGVEWRVAPK